MSQIDIDKILKEVKFNFSRSGGKGGQNVNKVETKAELVFNIKNSKLLDDEIKTLLKTRLKNKTDNDWNIRITSQSQRTQLGNRKKSIEKFIKLLNSALKKVKPRVKTKKSKSSKINVLEDKRRHGIKKKQRSNKDFETD